MSRLLPKSLAGQTLLILLAGLLASHLVGAWVYSADREEAVRAVGGLAAAQRVANLTRLVAEAPPDWRERIVAGSSDSSFRVVLSSQPRNPATFPRTPAAGAIENYLAAQIPTGAARRIEVALEPAAAPPFMMLHPHPMPPMLHQAPALRGLDVAVQLADDSWLSFATLLPDSGPGFSDRFMLSMSIMAILILLVSVWAVRRVTAPLVAIGRAAERLGRDVVAPPLAELGSIEMRQAARAFNEMQQRLVRLIENRTRMLAAISHDLRTPLTLLRLRAEAVADEEERRKMLATIDEMNAMIEATLAFARDEAAAETPRKVDLTALAASVADDFSDAGLTVAAEPSPSVIVECRPVALKRAITNLIDNAVKYGKAAHVAVAAGERAVEIVVEDEGPGIPESELSRVFQPFYRLEASRSRDTGGIGLGLAIALSVAEAHGGTLTLANRPEGGLRATLSLPR